MPQTSCLTTPMPTRTPSLVCGPPRTLGDPTGTQYSVGFARSTRRPKRGYSSADPKYSAANCTSSATCTVSLTSNLFMARRTFEDTGTTGREAGVEEAQHLPAYHCASDSTSNVDDSIYTINLALGSMFIMIQDFAFVFSGRHHRAYRNAENTRSCIEHWM